MNTQEKILYAILVSTNCIIAYHWALYGFLESTLTRPLKKALCLSMFIGVLSILISGILKRYCDVKFDYFSEDNMRAVYYVLVPPIALLIVLRVIFIKTGIPEYNRAMIATNHWKIFNFSPGELLIENGSNLSQFPLALRALRYFDKSICMQMNASIVNRSRFNSPLDRRTHMNIYYNNIENIALALSGKSILLRMMNRLDEAKKCVVDALGYMDEFLMHKPAGVKEMETVSLLNFQLAEIAHVQGLNSEAREYYSKCISIDSDLGKHEDVSFVKDLLQKLT